VWGSDHSGESACRPAKIREVETEGLRLYVSVAKCDEGTACLLLGYRVQGFAEGEPRSFTAVMLYCATEAAALRLLSQERKGLQKTGSECAPASLTNEVEKELM
jgi:hypothetical protein